MSRIKALNKLSLWQILKIKHILMRLSHWCPKTSILLTSPGMKTQEVGIEGANACGVDEATLVCLRPYGLISQGMENPETFHLQKLRKSGTLNFSRSVRILELTLLIDNMLKLITFYEKVSGKVTERVPPFKDYLPIPFSTFVHPLPSQSNLMAKTLGLRQKLS